MLRGMSVLVVSLLIITVLSSLTQLIRIVQPCNVYIHLILLKIQVEAMRYSVRRLVQMVRTMECMNVILEVVLQVVMLNVNSKMDTYAVGVAQLLQTHAHLQYVEMGREKGEPMSVMMAIQLVGMDVVVHALLKQDGHASIIQD